MNKKILMGIDGGGTYTRVLITDLEGNLLSHIKHIGGASFHKNPHAIGDVQNAIKEALAQCSYCIEDVKTVVCGIAGYDSEKDLVWVSELTNIEGLNCIKKNYNDGVIAHAGALLGQKGIIAIAGTGSIVLGLNEENRYIRNYDFKHNAYGASRLLSYNFTHRVLAGQTDASDEAIIKELLNHFHVNSIEELTKIGSYGFEKDPQLRDKQFGDFTRHITQAALQNSKLSQSICKETAFNIATGIQLVASTFKTNTIPYSLIGSVANSTYIKESIIHYLNKSKAKTFHCIDTPLSPELGAIILAMKENEIELNEIVVSNLHKTQVEIQQKEVTYAIS